MEKVTLQIGLEKFLRLKKVKITVPWTYVIEDFNEEKKNKFYENESQNSNQKGFRIKKVRKKAINYMWSGKFMPQRQI